jgi:hypothetical protein
MDETYAMAILIAMTLSIATNVFLVCVAISSVGRLESRLEKLMKEIGIEHMRLWHEIGSILVQISDNTRRRYHEK